MIKLIIQNLYFKKSWKLASENGRGHPWWKWKGHAMCLACMHGRVEKNKEKREGACNVPDVWKKIRRKWKGGTHGACMVCMHVWKWKGVCFANGTGETHWTREPDTTSAVSLMVKKKFVKVALLHHFAPIHLENCTTQLLERFRPAILGARMSWMAS